MSSPACMVLHCTGTRSEPDHEVPVLEPGDGWYSRPVCPEHWERIDGGELWLWVPARRLKGVGSTLPEGCILMGAELSGYGVVVDADVRMNGAELFSPDLVGGEPTPTLAIDGRIFGAAEQVAIELVLTPDTAQRLKEALRFFRPSSQS